jgi:hypothetical protein
LEAPVKIEEVCGEEIENVKRIIIKREKKMTTANE